MANCPLPIPNDDGTWSHPVDFSPQSFATVTMIGLLASMVLMAAIAIGLHDTRGKIKELSGNLADQQVFAEVVHTVLDDKIRKLQQLNDQLQRDVRLINDSLDTNLPAEKGN